MARIRKKGRTGDEGGQDRGGERGELSRCPIKERERMRLEN